MDSNTEIPDRVPADPSVAFADWLRAHLPREEGRRMTFLRLRERDDGPVLVLCSTGQRLPAFTVGPHTEFIALLVLDMLVMRALRPRDRETSIDLEDEDGERLGYAVVREGPDPQEHWGTKVSIYNTANEHLATFGLDDFKRDSG